MNRTLRALALVGLLGNVIYLVGSAVYYAGTPPVGGASSELGALILWAGGLQVVAWFGTTFTFVAGVVAAVATVQRRQRLWAVAVIGVLPPPRRRGSDARAARPGLQCSLLPDGRCIY